MEDTEESKKNSKKTIPLLFWILLITAILIRLGSINDVFFADDGNVAKIAERGELATAFIEHPHPPLGAVFLLISTKMFGLTNWSFKLPAFLFAIATLILVYHFTRKRFNETAALWTLAILIFSAWHIYGSTTNIGGEGILSFFLLATAYVFLKWENESWKKQIIIGIVWGVAFLVKETAILLGLIFIFYYIFQKKPWNKIIRSISAITVGFIIVALTFIIIDYFATNLSSVNALADFIQRKSIEGQGYTTPTIMHHGFSLLKIALWVSPLLVGLITTAFLSKIQIQQKTTCFCWTYILVYALFFLIYINPVFDKARYLLGTLPFIAILAGEYLAKQRITKKELGVIAVLSIVILLALSALNTQRSMISLDQKEQIFNEMKSGTFNVDIGIISDTGNPGFVINLRSVILAYLTTLLLLIGYAIFARKKANVARLCFLLFLAVGLGYNLFIAQEFLFHSTAPDYEKANKVLQEYALQHQLDEPIYLMKDPSMEFYLKKKYEQFYNIDTIQHTEQQLKAVEETIQTRGGTILLLDIPFIDKEGKLWKMITTNCRAVYTYEDKRITVGYVFECSDVQNNKEYKG